MKNMVHAFTPMKVKKTEMTSYPFTGASISMTATAALSLSIPPTPIAALYGLLAPLGDASEPWGAASLLDLGELVAALFDL